MILYIVRHAEAAAEMGDDRERPLTERGREQARLLGQKIAGAIGVIPEIRHSSRRRARDTAVILAAQLENDPSIYPSAGLEPEDDPADLIDELDLDPRPLMIVGHLPFVGNLVSMLIGSHENVAFEPATMAQLQFDGDEWRLMRLFRG